MAAVVPGKPPAMRKRCPRRRPGTHTHRAGLIAHYSPRARSRYHVVWIPALRRDDIECVVYCPGLIAQVTFTVIDSVSSPCATGVDVAPIGAASRLTLNIGAARPPSEMPKGVPSVTP